MFARFTTVINGCSGLGKPITSWYWLMVFIRNNGVWTQQGNKLVGTGGTGSIQHQGWSVSLSADGNTAIVGGIGNHSDTGAAWIFTRSGGTWTQQGNKLVGTGTVNTYAGQGSSVSLSADGNTAIVGGTGDNSYQGAAWVYTRSGGIWTQQGNKLVGTGVSGNADQGSSVSLSADGNTAIIGGPDDNYSAGAAWVFTRSGSIWTQQGNKLVGAGAQYQGWSVSLSADGNTAIVGAERDSSYTGSVWVYTRSGTIWTQQCSKLIGAGALNGLYGNGAAQGWSVSISADGRTFIEGGPQDSSNTGAAWVFISSPPISSTTYDTISSGALPYTWNGLTFTGAGTQTVQLTANNGCDSAATLVLSVLPTGINEINSASTIHLYPNPNKGSFTLQTSGSFGNNYTISDMLGHVIMQRSIRLDNEIIELPDAAEGVYTLSIKGAQPIRFAVLR